MCKISDIIDVYLQFRFTVFLSTIFVVLNKLAWFS